MTDSEKLDLILDKLVKLDTLEERIDALEKRIDALEKRIYSLEKRIYSLETDIKDIKFTIENEIRANLQAVAEGHLDLSRNLHDAIKPGNEIEMLIVKVRMLETDVR
ncbi:MAG: hypothetical protein K1W06_09440, partial [Lachnospiraceae bacterium]